MFEEYDRAVRCKDGHLFTTIWMPLISFKAVRLRGRRYQYCPVGGHWATVVSIDRASATRAELKTAAATHDVRVP